MLTLSTVLVVLALLAAIAGVANFQYGTTRTVNWVPLSLAFYFAAMLVRA